MRAIRRLHLAWIGVLLVAVNACHSTRTDRPNPRCPSLGPAPADNTAIEESLAGSYAVEFVGVAGSGKGRRTEGHLILKPRPDSLVEVRGLDGTLLSWIRDPLYGSLDADLEDVGAYVQGNVHSMDVATPGVVIREYDYAREEPPKRVVAILFGSLQNQSDIAFLDGPFVESEVTSIGSMGFAAWWEASIGPLTYRSAGYLCARRLTGSH
jgi:hypothetical protein